MDFEKIIVKQGRTFLLRFTTESGLPWAHIYERRTFKLFGKPLFQYWEHLHDFWTDGSRVKIALGWIDKKIQREQDTINEMEEIKKFCKNP